VEIVPFLFPRMKTVYASSLEDSKKEFVNLIHRTRSELLIIGGELNSVVYANHDIIEALYDAIDRGVEIVIGCGPDLDINDIDLMKMAKNRKISLYKLSKRELNHFRVADHKHVFLETSHTRLQMEDRRCVYVYNSRTLGPQYRSIFYQKIKEAEPVHAENITDAFNFIYYDPQTKKPVDAGEEQKIKLKELLQ
jgi:hypothetical protein